MLLERVVSQMDCREQRPGHRSVRQGPRCHDGAKCAVQVLEGGIWNVRENFGFCRTVFGGLGALLAVLHALQSNRSSSAPDPGWRCPRLLKEHRMPHAARHENVCFVHLRALVLELFIVLGAAVRVQKPGVGEHVLQLFSRCFLSRLPNSLDQSLQNPLSLISSDWRVGSLLLYGSRKSYRGGMASQARIYYQRTVSRVKTSVFRPSCAVAAFQCADYGRS